MTLRHILNDPRVIFPSPNGELEIPNDQVIFSLLGPIGPIAAKTTWHTPMLQTLRSFDYTAKMFIPSRLTADDPGDYTKSTNRKTRETIAAVVAHSHLIIYWQPSGEVEVESYTHALSRHFREEKVLFGSDSLEFKDALDVINIPVYASMDTLCQALDTKIAQLKKFNRGISWE